MSEILQQTKGYIKALRSWTLPTFNSNITKPQINNQSSHTTSTPSQPTFPKMKLSLTSALAVMTALSVNLTLAAPSPDNNPVARDVCGDGYPGYCRRIGSPCAASNGVHEFCSRDRTNIAKCRGGKWVDGKDCEAGGQQCVAREDGANAKCI
ncbi:hypothetical protein Q7P37_007471 [Cladosporium fusiforme]